MKIVIFSGIYEPDIGGPAFFTDVLRNKLIEMGYEVTIITYSQSSDFERKRGIVRIKIHKNKLRRLLSTFLASWKLIINSDRVIAVGMFEEVAIYCTLLRKKYMIRIVSDHVWEKYIREKNYISFSEFKSKNISSKFWFMQKAWNYAVKHSHKITILSASMMSSIPENYPNSKVFIVPNGVEIRKPSTEPNNFLYEVVYVGRFITIKNLDLLIESCALANASLLLIGSGPEEKALVEKAKLMKVKLSVAENLNQEELYNYLNQSKIYAQISSHEGMSFSLLQAMASGKPCIVSNIEANRAIIENNHNGVVLEELDAITISTKIKELLGNEESRNEIGNNALRTIEEYFTLDRMVGTYCNLIRDWD
jgi:glycosyltransferase involved in cell wall biosynthesis